jgi:ABC-2 type transport system permease protein
MTDLLAAEWLKLRSLRSTWWTLGLVALAVQVSAFLAAHADYANFPSYDPDEQRTHGFALADAFPLAGYLILMIVAVAAGSNMITAEYGTGLIRTVTVAVPARGELLLAKAAVLAAVWTVGGAVIAAGSFTTAWAVLSGRHAAASLSDPGAVAALAGAALVAPVCALIGLGVGVLIRHGSAAAVTGIIVLALLPALISTRQALSAAVNHAMVLPAWRRLTHAYGPPDAVGDLYASFRGSWVVYAAWPVTALVLALFTIRRRDV